MYKYNSEGLSFLVYFLSIFWLLLQSRRYGIGKKDFFRDKKR
jgi:hypothetical protein